MPNERKDRIKKILSEIPLTAEVFWLVHRTDNPANVRYSLRHIKEVLPETIEAAQTARKHAQPGKKVFLFASMHYWLEHIAMMGVALSGQGNDVTLGYFPYAKWNIVQSKFDVRRQAVYTKSVLKPVESVMKLVDLFSTNGSYVVLPDELKHAVDLVTGYDYMYAFQTEEVDPNHEFYHFRYERNMLTAKVLYNYLRSNRPDSVIIPNGTVMELGVAYRVCRFLRIPVVTYEFSEQKQTMWLTQNDEVMKQDTELLWKRNADLKLSDAHKKKIETLISSRKNAVLFTNFSRQWQNAPSEGAMQTKSRLKLDDRPIVLLATNVLGDSLTLGRQVFSKSMTEWVIRTVQYFIERKDVQLVIRIHPGEAQVKNASIYDKIRETLPHLPDHIHVIGPKDDVNTYDVMELADVGLVYTTTVGLEMAMSGIPVEVAGKTHYRGRGFTYDPESWVEYFKILSKLLSSPRKTRLSKSQMELAWKYAYLFFFEYPHPYPWHIFFRREDFNQNSMKAVLSADGKKKFADTFELLTLQKKED
jgi:hypothetical protein